jgi:cysteine desulfurase
MDIYLDNSATTRPCREATEAVKLAMEEAYGNPSSMHIKGFDA